MSRIAIIGSSDLWVTPDVAIQVATLILATELDSEIRIRAKNDGMPPKFTSPLEGFVYAFAMKSGRVPHAFTPLFVRPNPQAGVFDRDKRLIERIERLYAFLDPSAAERRHRGGTFGIVQLAINTGIPTEAWTINDHGDLEDIGSTISQEEVPTWSWA